VDRAVAKEGINPSRMPAPGSRECAPLGGLVVAPQASSQLTIALRARVGSSQTVPRMSSGAPCKISEATCVLLVPSVNEPIRITIGPVPLGSSPNGDCRKRLGLK
jgi:hypothetical protein